MSSSQSVLVFFVYYLLCLQVSKVETLSYKDHVKYNISKYFFYTNYNCFNPWLFRKGGKWCIRRCKLTYTANDVPSPSCIFCPVSCSLCGRPYTKYYFGVNFDQENSKIWGEGKQEQYYCHFHSLHAVEPIRIRSVKGKTMHEDMKCPPKKFCSSSPCQNGGTCSALFYSYTCICPDTHYGKHCENDAGKFAGKLTHGVQIWFPLEVIASRLFPFLVTVAHEGEGQIIEVSTYLNYINRFTSSGKIKDFKKKCEKIKDNCRCGKDTKVSAYKGTLMADTFYLKEHWDTLPIFHTRSFAIGTYSNVTIKVFNKNFNKNVPVYQETIDSFMRFRQQTLFTEDIHPSCDCQIYSKSKKIDSAVCGPTFDSKTNIDPGEYQFSFMPIYVAYAWRLFNKLGDNFETGLTFTDPKKARPCKSDILTGMKFHWRFYKVSDLPLMTDKTINNQAFEVKNVCKEGEKDVESMRMCVAKLTNLDPGDYMVRLQTQAYRASETKVMDDHHVNYYCYFQLGQIKRSIEIVEKSPITECIVNIDTRGFDDTGTLRWTCTSKGKGKCPAEVSLNNHPYLQVNVTDGTYEICVEWDSEDGNVVGKPCIEVIAKNCEKAKPKPDLIIKCEENCGSNPDPTIPQKVVVVDRNNPGVPPEGVKWKLVGPGPNGPEIPIEDVTIPGGVRPGGFEKRLNISKLEPGKDYYITAVDDKNDTSSPHKIFYKAAEIPVNGNCTVSPLQGMRGFTLFDIECFGWQADGPILYEFFDKSPDDIDHYQGRMIGYSYSGILTKFRLTRGRVVIYLLNADGNGPSVNMTVELVPFDRNMTHIQYLIDEIDEYMDYDNYQPSLDMMSTIAEILEHNMKNEYYIQKIISTMYKVELDSAESMKLALSTILSVLVNGTQKGTYLLDDILEKYTGKILLTIAKSYLKYATQPDHKPRMRAKHIHQLSRNMMDCVDMSMIAQDKNVTKLGPEEDINYDVMDNLNEASNDIAEALMIAVYLVGRVQPYAAEGIGITSSEKVTDMWAYVNNAVDLVNVAGSNMTSFVNISEDLAHTFNYNHDIMLQFAPMKKNLFWWAQDNVNTEVIFAGLAEKLYRPGYYFVPTFKYPVNIYMKVKKMVKTTVRGVVTQLDPNLDEDTLDKTILVHRFILPPLSKLYITFIFENSSSPLRVQTSFNERPTWQSMTEESIVISPENPQCDSPYDVVEREHFYYMGILPDKSVAVGETVDYAFDVNFVNCHIWENQWVNHYCLVGPKTSEDSVECQCTHMSIFSSSIFVPPNDINPILDAPLFLTVAENPWVVIFVIIVLLLFLLLLLWAFMKDRKDALCSDVIVLHDNFPGESYSYLIAIFTGSRLTSGTSAVVGFRLYGDTYASRPAILKCDTRKVLQRDDDDWFLLCYPVSLGILNAVQMWHDNTGRCPDWFCSKVIVYDLRAKTQYIFLVDQWLAMEADEFPEAMIRPATTDEIMNIKRIFLDNSVLGLRENHLHLSVLTRHPRSPVSRKQRLVVLMVLVMSAMLASIMFFKITDKFDENVDEYHYSVGQRELMISIQSFIISTIFAMIAMFLFRKGYKQKEYHRSHSTLFMPRKRSSITDKYWRSDKPAYVDLSTFIAYSEKPPKQRKDMSMFEAFIAAIRNCTHQKALRPVHLHTDDSTDIKVNKGWLTAAWVFSILVIVICAYLVMLYSLKFGKIKSLKWLSSLVMTQTQDIFLFSPAKILILAILLSAAFERTTDISAFKLDVNKAIKSDLIGNKKYLNDLVESRKQSTYYPMSDEVKAKKRRKAMRKMKWRIIVDFVAVLFYIFILCFIMRVLWSGSHYYPNTHAGDIMMQKYHGRFIALQDVFNRTQFFSYLQNTFVRSLFVFRWFSDLNFPILSPPGELERKDWAKDYISKMVGAPRLRQLRVIKGSCTTQQTMIAAVRECNPTWSTQDMDTEVYSVAWKKATYDDLVAYEWGQRTYWIYTTPKNTSVFPISGKTGITYPPGGYILPLDVKRASTRFYAISVEEEHWLDERTRGVFLELTLYNVNNHLFSQVTAVIEHMTSGLYMTSANVDSVHTQEDWSVWNVIYIIFIVILILRIAYKMNRNGLFHFVTRYLNVYEVLVIVISILSVVYYLIHLKNSSFYVEQFRREGLDRFFHFKEMIKYFLYTKVFLWVLFCLLVFRLFVSWYFGPTYVFFYNTFVLSKRWVVILMLASLFYFYIIWRFIGYVIDAVVFYNYRVNILHHKMYSSIFFDRAFQHRAKMIALALCFLSLFFKVIFFMMFAHYYQIGKRKKLNPMQYFNIFTFVLDQVKICFGKKQEESINSDRQIHRKRDMKIPRKSQI